MWIIRLRVRSAAGYHRYLDTPGLPMDTCKMEFLFLIFVSCAMMDFRCDATYAGPMHKPETERTLYADLTDIQELFVSNFTQVVCRSTKAWAAQFYSATCGGCQRFRPVWLELANDISSEYKRFINTLIYLLRYVVHCHCVLMRPYGDIDSGHHWLR